MRWILVIACAVWMTVTGGAVASHSSRDALLTKAEVKPNSDFTRLARSRRKQPPPKSDNSPASPANPEVAKQFKLFDQIFERVRTDYVDPPDTRELLLGAVDGMREAFPTGSPSNVLA